MLALTCTARGALSGKNVCVSRSVSAQTRAKYSEPTAAGGLVALAWLLFFFFFRSLP